MKKKTVRYEPKKPPSLTDDEAAALEKRLRTEIDSWARLQSDELQSRYRALGRITKKLFPNFNKKRRT